MLLPLYPLLFTTRSKSVLWGGHRLESMGRGLPGGIPVGESWEIFDRPDAQSQVVNGPLKGIPIEQLIEEYGPTLMGTKFTGKKFPLMVKLIDAEKQLSLQVHPDKRAAEIIGGGAESKTEMWYVLETKSGSTITAGLKDNVPPEAFWNSLGSADMEQYLQIFDSSPGDAYFVKAGTVHAIGQGNLILEIQENSDTTYRIYDWGRVEPDGKPRQLHLPQARQSISLEKRESARVQQTELANGIIPLIRCDSFNTDKVLVSGTKKMSDGTGESFHLLSVVQGKITIRQDDFLMDVPFGTSVLIPARYGCFVVISEQPSAILDTWL